MPASLETIANLAKQRGFVFQSSEIYGGIRSAYDYGPLGVELLQERQERVVARHGPGAGRRGRPRLGDSPGPSGVEGLGS